MTREEIWDEGKALAVGVLIMLVLISAVLLFHEQKRESYNSWEEKLEVNPATAN